MKPLPDVAAEFDAIAGAIAAGRRPDAFTRAERFLLRQVPPGARTALDVGCGHGALSRALAGRGIATLGVDASPGMIALARARAGASPLLDYRVSDVVTEPPPSTFDVVVSVAMAHHAPLERVLEYLVAAVAPGGTLVVQDVITRRGARGLPANAAAWLARRLRLVPVRAVGAAVAALYAAHGEDETYLDAREVRGVYARLLPGARVHLHLEWRYTTVWRAAHPSTPVHRP